MKFYIQKSTGNIYRQQQQPFFNRQMSGESPIVQTKMTVTSPTDDHEKEADHTADKVMRHTEGVVSPVSALPITPVQRKCDHCEEDDKKAHRKETSATTAGGFVAPPSVSRVVGRGGGQALDGSARTFMESRFGRRFDNVQIHTDSEAARSAQDIQAKAYTSGQNIVFADGQYQPNTEGGRHLLAHELTHVLQQNNGSPTSIQRKPKNENVWGLNVDGSMCKCMDTVKENIDWANTAADTYAACDIPANSDSVAVQDCFKKAHPSTAVVGTTSSGGVVTLPPASKDPCSIIDNKSTFVHEIMHFRHTKNLVKKQGDAFYQEWNKLKGDPDQKTKLAAKFPDKAKAFQADFHDGHDWATDEVHSYKSERRFLEDTKSALNRIC